MQGTVQLTEQQCLWQHADSFVYTELAPARRTSSPVSSLVSNRHQHHRRLNDPTNLQDHACSLQLICLTATRRRNVIRQDQVIIKLFSPIELHANGCANLKSKGSTLCPQLVPMCVDTDDTVHHHVLMSLTTLPWPCSRSDHYQQCTPPLKKPFTQH